MTLVRVFKSGDSQTAALPEEFMLEDEELEIFRRGDEVVLRPSKVEGIARAFELLASLPDDFLPERGDAPPQIREES